MVFVWKPYAGSFRVDVRHCTCCLANESGRPVLSLVVYRFCHAPTRPPKMFKKKSKKSSSSALPPPPPPDANLEDDLFAQLDAQDQANVRLGAQSIAQSQKSTTTITTTTSTDSTQSTKLQKPKKDSKLRFKAREVRSFPTDCVAWP